MTGFTDADLLFLIDVLMPHSRDKGRMIRVLGEDSEILEGMLADERLLRRLLNDPESIIRVSPRLFFGVLLNRVKKDFTDLPYTLEHSRRQSMVVFDGAEVLKLLETPGVNEYLRDMLVSFVRINSHSRTVRVRKGVWHRFSFNDFEIDSLMRFSRAIDESQRFPPYKRIADICLFTIGMLSDLTREGEHDQDATASRFRSSRNRAEYTEQGRYYYRIAARHESAQVQEVSDVMLFLADNLTIAAKPLSLMMSRYLEPFKERVFLQ